MSEEGKVEIISEESEKKEIEAKTANEEKKEEKEKDQKAKSLEKPYSQKNFFERLLTPGVDNGILSSIRVIIFFLMLFLIITYFLTWNIHFFVMSVLTLCLYYSFEYLVKQLKESDLLNPEETKELREKEEAKKKKEEEEKAKQQNEEK